MWHARKMLRQMALVALCFSSGTFAAPPLVAPPQFMTGMYGLTLKVPTGAFYCPLPSDWVGSDHGTTIFLQRPRSCGGVGYPSSSRSFQPAQAARIQIYYGYVTWDETDAPPRPRCKQVASIRFLGASRQVCERKEAGLVIREVQARYKSDSDAEAVLTLVTTTKRLKADMATFRLTAVSVRPCSQQHESNKEKFVVGTGAACPAHALHF